MTDRGLAIFFIGAVTIAAILVAGCVQGTSGSQDQSAAGSAVSPQAQQAQQTQQGQNTGATAANSSRHSTGQGFTSNATRIAAAADKLGVSAQQLTDALSTVNATTGRTGSFTDGAQKLGVTEQQLRDAFGFPAGGRPSGSFSRQPTGTSSST
jgi:hypothetical protein